MCALLQQLRLEVLRLSSGKKFLPRRSSGHWTEVLAGSCPNANATSTLLSCGRFQHVNGIEAGHVPFITSRGVQSPLCQARHLRHRHRRGTAPTTSPRRALHRASAKRPRAAATSMYANQAHQARHVRPCLDAASPRSLAVLELFVPKLRSKSSMN